MCGRYEYTPGEFREIRIRWSLDKEVPVIVGDGEHWTVADESLYL
jgi:hypothetical protein